jgi:hypothetical protein
MKKKFTKSQRNRLSEILGNVSVAYLTVGFVGPLINKPQNLVDFLFTFVISLIMAMIVLMGSLFLATE